MARIAFSATVWPKLAPIDCELGSSANPNRSRRVSSTRSTSFCCSSSALIWTTLRPSSGLSTVWISASPSPSGASVSRTCSTVAGRSSGAVMRVPPSKSIPKLSPRMAIASAHTSRIRPEIEKNHREPPMKSNRIGLESRAPSAARERSRRVPRRAYRIAWVASTAVNSDTITPTPSVSAKPRTPEVASTNRMKATRIVTTLASRIAVRPFL